MEDKYATVHFKICSRLFTLEDRVSFEAVPVTAVITKKIMSGGYLGPIIQKVTLNVIVAQQVIFIFSQLDTKHLRDKMHLLLINYPFEITIF